MHFLVFLLHGFLFLLSIPIIQVNGKEDVSYNYIFDYITNIEVKVGEKEYSSFLNYTGHVESSPYILTDNQELVLVKLHVNACNGLKTKTSMVGIIIRRKGLVERIIVDMRTENGILNLFKGVVNMMSIDELRGNKPEADVAGECDVIYESVKEDLLVKEKSGCNKTTFHSSDPEVFDSFSIYHDPKIKIHYQFNKDGALITVNSLETHLLESVISEDLSQTYKSTTALLLNKVTQSTSLISSATVDMVIDNVFGKNHKDVFLPTISEVGYNEPVTKESFLEKYKKIKSSYGGEKRAQNTLELIKLLRTVIDRSLFKTLDDKKLSSDVVELMHDAFIGCSTKLCSEMVIIEFDKCLKEDENEANRMLLMMQHVSRSSEYMIKSLWTRLNSLSEGSYDQALQTISSMIERVTLVEHMQGIVNDVVVYIQGKLLTCDNDLCFQVHLSAVRNTKLPQLRETLLELLARNGKLSNSVTASVYNSICSLNYDANTRVSVQRLLLERVKKEINFYIDDHLKYEAIFCLVRMGSDIEEVIRVLDSLQDYSHHLSVFLVRKIKELISMGILEEGDKILVSKFFRQQTHQDLTYKDESKMLVNQLASSRTLYSDIHFNVVGQDGGVIRNSMTDIFLVSTARENHLLSLATHINGLQSVAGTGSGDKNEPVEGLLQLILFGKEARPIQMFQGTSELMSALWYAPSSLKSLLSGTFVPIDLHREIVFQNGVVLSLSYSGSTYIDFSFKLNSNLWYKTATSLLRVTGEAYISMSTTVKSLSNNVNHVQSLSMKSGLDFDTSIDFSSSQMKNCLSVSRSVSQVNLTTIESRPRIRRHSSLLKTIEGCCYSLSKATDHLCSSF